MRVPVATLLEWDTITRVSETHLSVGGRYIDSLINVGCRNPIKTVVSETSFFPYLEISPDTYGPTVDSPQGLRKSRLPTTACSRGWCSRCTTNWMRRARPYACAKGDGQSRVEPQPISSDGLQQPRQALVFGQAEARQVRRRGFPAEVQCEQRELPVVPQPVRLVQGGTAGDSDRRRSGQPARRAVRALGSDQARLRDALPAVDPGERLLRGTRHLPHTVVRFGTRDSQACGGVQQCTPPQLS